MKLTSEDILAVAQSLPMTTQLFARVGQLLRDPEVPLEAVARLIRTDSVASFRILQGANGVLYGLREPCSDVENAVQRLGGREINRLLGVIAAQQLGSTALPLHGVSGTQLRDNSLRCALGAEWLAQRVDHQSGSTAYAAGILRSVGKVALNRAGPRHTPAGGARPADQLLPAWEQEQWGLDSSAAGAVLLSSWRLPEVLVTGIARQFDVLDNVGGTLIGGALIAWAVQLAARVADQAGWGLPGESGCWPTAEELCLLGAADPDECLPALTSAVDAQMELLQAIVGNAA